MYPTTSLWTAALAGGSVAVQSSVAVTYDGAVILDRLELEAGGSIVSEFTGEAVTSRFTGSAIDQDGSLFNADGRAPLMPFGQRLMVRVGLSDRPTSDDQDPTYQELIPAGRYRINAPKQDRGQPWRLYPSGVWVPTAQKVSVEARDLLQQLALEPSVSALQPVLNGTVRSEVARVLKGFMPMSPWPAGLPNPVVPKTMVYSNNRLTTVQDLLQLSGAVPWMARDGSLCPLAPKRKASPVWTIGVADPAYPDESGALIEYNPALDADSIVNGVSVISEDGNGHPLTGAAYTATGMLRWGGPFGQVLREVQDTKYTSNAKAKAGAVAELAKATEAFAVPIEVTTLPNFAVDPLDTVAVVTPTSRLLGMVTSITYPLSADLMKMTLSVPLTDVLDLS